MSEGSKITVVIKEPNQAPRIEQIENTLEAFQKAVGGYIQAVPYNLPGTQLICNEEGKLENLPFNFWFGVNDYIAGTAVICTEEESEFASLDELQQIRVMRLLE